MPFATPFSKPARLKSTQTKTKQFFTGVESTMNRTRICLWLAGCLAASTAAVAEPIIIGQSAPLTGVYATFGRDISQGAQAYFRKINIDGGIQGRTLMLVSLDDKNDPVLAGINAKKLINDRGATVLFGFGSSGLTLPAAEHAKAAKVSIIAPFTGAEPVRKPGLPIYTVRSSYEHEMDKLIEHWSDMGFKTAAFIHYDDEVGRTVLAMAQRVLAKSGRSAVSIPIKRNSPMASATIAAIENAGTAVIINGTSATSFAEILKALKLTKKSYLNSTLSFVDPNRLIEEAQANATGVVVAHAVPFPGSSRMPIVRECADAMKLSGFGELTFASLESCVSAKVLVEALKRTKGPVTRESITASFNELGKLDVGGYTVNFTGTQHGGSFVDLSAINRAGSYSN
jgi:branched-chain amino acid transport system substrate-binding protein